jgi:hypothetical protein
MANLPRFNLSKDSDAGDWKLRNVETNRVVRRFETKADATAGGALERAVGSNGGSVRIQKENGQIQEERTYPGSRDPKNRPG